LRMAPFIYTPSHPHWWILRVLTDQWISSIYPTNRQAFDFLDCEYDGGGGRIPIQQRDASQTASCPYVQYYEAPRLSMPPPLVHFQMKWCGWHSNPCPPEQSTVNIQAEGQNVQTTGCHPQQKKRTPTLSLFSIDKIRL
jgi:hypothetical protein